MKQPKRKHAKMSSLVGLKWTKDSALEGILNELQKNGNLVGVGSTNRRSLNRQVDVLLNVSTHYGPMIKTMLLPMHDGN